MPFGQVTISWSRNGEADLAGYRVYYGTSPSPLSFLQDVGVTATPLAPTVTITEFPQYGPLFFAVTAYDTSNNESSFSSTVTKAVAPKLLPIAWG
jgi:hypothetical protein